MTRKSEIFRLNKDGVLPKELSDRLIAPEGVDLREPLLKPFVREGIVMPSVDIVAMNVQRFYLEVMSNYNPFCVFNECCGLYVSKNNYYCSDEILIDMIKKLKNDYNIDLSEVILIRRNKPNYFTVVHEYLHAFFDHLPEEKRNMLVNSIKSYDQLPILLHLTHLNTFNFNWPDKTSIYTLDKLERSNQLYCVDEIISSFFDHREQVIAPVLPQFFIDAMEKVGYNMTNPPEVRGDAK
jgi:hypothetical protein